MILDQPIDQRLRDHVWQVSLALNVCRVHPETGLAVGAPVDTTSQMLQGQNNHADVFQQYMRVLGPMRLSGDPRTQCKITHTNTHAHTHTHTHTLLHMHRWHGMHLIHLLHWLSGVNKELNLPMFAGLFLTLVPTSTFTTSTITAVTQRNAVGKLLALLHVGHQAGDEVQLASTR